MSTSRFGLIRKLTHALRPAHGPLREAVVHHSIHGRFSIRQGPWKLELCPGSGGWGKPGDADAAAKGLPGVQLYDLSRDMAEGKNVQAEHPEAVARLTQLLEGYVSDGRSTPGAKQANDVSVVFDKDNAKPKRRKPRVDMIKE